VPPRLLQVAKPVPPPHPLLFPHRTGAQPVSLPSFRLRKTVALNEHSLSVAAVLSSPPIKGVVSTTSLQCIQSRLQFCSSTPELPQRLAPPAATLQAHRRPYPCRPAVVEARGEVPCIALSLSL
jgi:hypothetical protein